MSGSFISPVEAILVAALRSIQRIRSWNVETVRTVLENLVFMMPISKNILEITGIEVIATPIVKTSPKLISLPASPMKLFLNIPMKGIAPSIGRTVAPRKMKNIVLELLLSASSLVL